MSNHNSAFITAISVWVDLPEDILQEIMVRIPDKRPLYLTCNRLYQVCPDVKFWNKSARAAASCDAPQQESPKIKRIDYLTVKKKFARVTKAYYAAMRCELDTLEKLLRACSFKHAFSAMLGAVSAKCSASFDWLCDIERTYQSLNLRSRPDLRRRPPFHTLIDNVHSNAVFNEFRLICVAACMSDHADRALIICGREHNGVAYSDSMETCLLKGNIEFARLFETSADGQTQHVFMIYTFAELLYRGMVPAGVDYILHRTTAFDRAETQDECTALNLRRAVMFVLDTNHQYAIGRVIERCQNYVDLDWLAEKLTLTYPDRETTETTLLTMLDAMSDVIREKFLLSLRTSYSENADYAFELYEFACEHAKTSSAP